MLLTTSENRKSIIKYLQNIDEDSFIEEFVIPFFTSFGFQVYRINSHGGGEHGKDIILSRYLPHFLDTEYVAVQAKAETVNTSNVDKIAQQINRSLQVSFPSKSGHGSILPNYAIFVNAKRHTNDANTEFPNLIKSPQYVRILTQENVCDLIISYGIGPEELISRLSQADSQSMSQDDKTVYDALMNDPSSIDCLLDHQLPLLRHRISRRLQEMVIDAIYYRWKADTSWSGTVKPMKWFDTYFDFFTERQYSYFLDIFKEFTSSTRSIEASSNTRSVIKKISPQMWATQSKAFIYENARTSIDIRGKDKDLVREKLLELKKLDLVSDKKLKTLMCKTIKLLNLSRGDDKYTDIYDGIQNTVYPELAERRRHRTKSRG